MMMMMMMMDELLLKLNTDNSFQQDTLKQAIVQKEAITPFLLDIILDYPKLNVAKYRYNAFLYALYLLAQFKEKAAYPIIVDFILQNKVNDIFAPGCDIVTESLGRILASVYDSDLSLIKQIIEKRTIDNELRDAGLRALIVLYNNDQLLRGDLITYLAYLIKNNIEEEKNPLFGASLLTYCFSIYPEEFYDLILVSYENEVINRDIINLDDIGSQMCVGKEIVLEQLKASRHAEFITDVISELKVCGCFN